MMDYDVFEKEYMDNRILVSDLEKKYGVHCYRKLRRLVKERTGFTRKGGRKSSKYYYYDKAKEKWIVVRRINGVKTEFSSYDEESTAKKVVDLFNFFGWDKSYLDNIKVMAYG